MIRFSYSYIFVWIMKWMATRTQTNKPNQSPNQTPSHASFNINLQGYPIHHSSSSESGSLATPITPPFPNDRCSSKLKLTCSFSRSWKTLLTPWLVVRSHTCTVALEPAAAMVAGSSGQNPTENTFPYLFKKQVMIINIKHMPSIEERN